MAFDWIFWLGIVDFIATGWLLIRFRSKLLSTDPDIEELEDDLNELYITVQELQKRMQIEKAYLMDMVEGTLRPLNRKIGLREKREQEKDLNPINTLKRGGIIGFRHKDGFNKQD